MSTIDRISGPPASNVAFAQTTARPTPTPVSPGVSFGATLAAGGKGLLKGATGAVSVLPGGSQIAASVRGGGGSGMTPMSYGGGTTAGTLGGGAGAGVTPEGPGGGGGGIAVGGSVSGGAGGVGVGVGAGSAGGLASTGDSFADANALLDRQVAVQVAAEVFQTTSNIENAGHQAKMGAIQNLRC